MNQDAIEISLTNIERKLDALSNDLRDHTEHERIMFYGEDGTNGLVGDMIELKQSRRFYNRILAGLGTLLAGVIGDIVWRAFK